MITQKPAFTGPEPAQPEQPVQSSPTLRIALIGCGFFAITTTLLLLQPDTSQTVGAAPAPAPAAVKNSAATTQVQVSRAETGLDLLGTGAPPVDGVPNVDPLSAVVQASLRATTAQQPVKTPPVSAATANDTALKALSEGVLAGLGKPSTLTGAAPKSDPMRDMTAGVLASLTDTRTPAGTTGSNPTSPAPAANKNTSLETLISQALTQGKSDAYLDALLNEAAAAGLVAVPAALQTNDGKVDTATLIATLIKQTPADPNAAPPLESFASGKGVEVRVVQRAGQTRQYNFYTVQSGDSLGSIARKFYGDARFHTKIFEANRQFLASPNKIRPGQRLSIPKLTAS
ncbi:LysM peptidoglycan-binding domain-containing protein [Rhodobacteraceae bacterium D3-12]|nr:LysM peptidoglycan-binding domain-containing protein [Rhodobacteraceae bacterium D3-12]